MGICWPICCDNLVVCTISNPTFLLGICVKIYCNITFLYEWSKSLFCKIMLTNLLQYRIVVYTCNLNCHIFDGKMWQIYCNTYALCINGLQGVLGGQTPLRLKIWVDLPLENFRAGYPLETPSRGSVGGNWPPSPQKRN